MSEYRKRYRDYDNDGKLLFNIVETLFIQLVF